MSTATKFIIFMSVCIGVVFIFSDIRKKYIVETEINNNETYRILKKMVELGYAEGQRDAMNGRIIIEHIDSNMYRFNSSPWNDGSMFEAETLLLHK